MSFGISNCLGDGCGEIINSGAGLCPRCSQAAAARNPMPTAQAETRRGGVLVMSKDRAAFLIAGVFGGVFFVGLLLALLALSSGGNLASDGEREYRAEIASRRIGMDREGLEK